MTTNKKKAQLGEEPVKHFKEKFASTDHFVFFKHVSLQTL